MSESQPITQAAEVMGFGGVPTTTTSLNQYNSNYILNIFTWISVVLTPFFAIDRDHLKKNTIKIQSCGAN